MTQAYGAGKRWIFAHLLYNCTCLCVWWKFMANNVMWLRAQLPFARTRDTCTSNGGFLSKLYTYNNIICERAAGGTSCGESHGNSPDDYIEAWFFLILHIIYFLEIKAKAKEKKKSSSTGRLSTTFAEILIES